MLFMFYLLYVKLILEGE